MKGPGGGEGPLPGLGWRWNLLDFLMSRYGMTYKNAMLFPLGTAARLMGHVRDVASGGTSPENPVIAAMLRARQRVRRWYVATHEIIAPVAKGVGRD